MEVNLYYYGYRYYSAKLGRWISRDPMGEALSRNLIFFVSNSPTINIDLFGMWKQSFPNNISVRRYIRFPFSEADVKDLLKNITSPMTWLQNDSKCKKWIQKEINKLEWIKELPDCPCELDMCSNPPKVPDYANEKEWGKCGKAPSSHPGGTWEIRSVSFHGHGQQCIYNKEGKLLTEFAAAGTPDKAFFPDDPTFNEIWGHTKDDLLPWLWCGGDEHAYFLYNKVRPPNKGRGKGGKPCERI